MGTGVVRQEKYSVYWCSAARRIIVGTGVVRPGVLLWVLVKCGQEEYCGYWCSAYRKIIVATGVVRPG